MLIAHQARTAYLLLRVGAAFAFLYPPISALLGDPYTWFGYFPPFLTGYVSDMLLLHLFGVVEVVIGLWILSGYKIFVPSMVATGMLVAIVLFNLSQFDVLFRDLSIACLTCSLALIHQPKKYYD
jgi:uncharacterized membrane protein YphA (DoxX/SURF4 family)